MIRAGDCSCPPLFLSFWTVLRCKYTAISLNNKKKTVKNVKTIVFAAEMIVYAGNLAIFTDSKDA